MRKLKNLKEKLLVVVVGGKVIGAMKRESVDGDFRANITRGGEAKPIDIDEQMEYLALESTKLLGLDISGVDLLFDGDSYKIAYNGHSAAYDFKGETLVNLEEQEQIQVITLNYTALEEYRSKFPAWKDADNFTIHP